MKYEFHWVDIAKFFFAICIVALHANIAGNSIAGYYIESLVFRLAVPYFFVASGFFFGLKCYDKSVYNGSSPWGGAIKRLIIKLLVFEPIAIIVASIPLIGTCTLHEYIHKMIRHIIFYPYGSLWYVNALIVAVMILTPAIKHNKEKLALLSGVLLYLVFLLFNRYNFLVEDTALQPYIKQILSKLISLRNGLFVGLLFVGSGVLIAKNLYRLKHISSTINTIAIAAFAMLVAEVYIIRDYRGIDDNSFYLSFPIVVPLIFMMTILFPYSYRKSTTVLRNLSTSIYFMQKPLLGLFALAGFATLDRFFATLGIIGLLCVMIYPKKVQPIYDWIR